VFIALNISKIVYFFPGVCFVTSYWLLLLFWFIIIDEVLDAKQWLQADGLAGDINLVKAKWLITYDLRKKEVFESEDRLLSTIFQSWPILQGPKGYELVCLYLTSMLFK